MSNLEIIAKRNSGDDYLAKVRYDLSAQIDGKMQTVAQEVSHPVRLSDLNGALTLVLPKARAAE